MKMLAYLLAVVCLVLAVVYFVIPADTLPVFIPGHDAQVHHPHHKHAAVALIAAIILFVIGWFVGRRQP
jgi:amino acid permease